MSFLKGKNLDTEICLQEQCQVNWKELRLAKEGGPGQLVPHSHQKESAMRTP